MTLKIGSLFSGTGMLDQAVANVFGAEPAWFCEYDKHAAKILQHHWPHIPNHRDVTAVDWAEVEPVDIITGGSPCQDLSTSGKRAGMTEGTRSNLWVNMREAINTIKPTYVVWENVKGALSAKAYSESDLESGDGQVGEKGGDNLRALGRVLGDLTEIGYDCRWTTIRASDIGAPHHRERVFVLATLSDSAGFGLEAGQLSGRQSAEVSEHHSSGHPFSDSDCFGFDRGGNAPEPPSGQVEATDRHGSNFRWGEYEPVVRRWESIFRPAPDPVEPGRNGRARLNAEFAEWMMGLPEGHVTSVDIPRSAQLKALGNGVVPSQCAAALTYLLEVPEFHDLNSASNAT